MIPCSSAAPMTQRKFPLKKKNIQYLSGFYLFSGVVFSGLFVFFVGMIQNMVR